MDAKEPKLFEPGGLRKIEGDGLNVVLPFVGGGSIFRVLYDLDVPIKSIAIVEYDDNKVKQAKNMIRKLYPHIDVDSEHSANFMHQKDATILPNWDKVAQFEKDQGGCDFFWGTPSCATNSRLAGFGGNKEFMVTGSNGYDVPATEDMVNAMAIEDLIKEIDKHGKSGGTFTGMMYGLKEIQPKSGGTEHGEISRPNLRRAYTRVMNDRRGLPDDAEYFERHHVSGYDNKEKGIHEPALTDTRRDRDIGHFSSGPEDTEIWNKAKELFAQEGLKVNNDDIGYYSDRKDIKTMADIRRQLFQDNMDGKEREYTRRTVENVQPSFTKSEANTFYHKTNTVDGKHKKGEPYTQQEIANAIAIRYARRWLTPGGYAREANDKDDPGVVFQFKPTGQINNNKEEVIEPTFTNDPEKTAHFFAKNSRKNMGAGKINKDIIGKNVVFEGYTPQDMTLQMGKNKDDISEDLYAYHQNLGDSEDERLRYMSVIRELGLLNHLPPDQKVLAAKEIWGSMWKGGYVG